MCYSGYKIGVKFMKSVDSKGYLKITSNSKRKSGVNRSGKYNAKKVRVDNILFDSKLEAQRYIELKELMQIGIIKNLKTHKKYPLVVNGYKVTTYEADFVYERGGLEVIEDTKGVLTKEYKIKKKLMKAIYNKDIIEIYSKSKK